VDFIYFFKFTAIKSKDLQKKNVEAMKSLKKLSLNTPFFFPVVEPVVEPRASQALYHLSCTSILN
jgi:hypothetical protein